MMVMVRRLMNTELYRVDADTRLAHFPCRRITGILFSVVIGSMVYSLVEVHPYTAVRIVMFSSIYQN